MKTLQFLKTMDERHSQQFLESTTVHGLIYFKSKKKLTKFIWGIIVAVCVFLCAWQSGLNVQDYLTYDVITKETYDLVDVIQYPAITMWNPNVARRTIIGRQLWLKYIASQFLGVEFMNVRRFKIIIFE